MMDMLARAFDAIFYIPVLGPILFVILLPVWAPLALVSGILFMKNW